MDNVPVRYLGTNHSFYTTATGNNVLLSIDSGNIILDSPIKATGGNISTLSNILSPDASIVFGNNSYLSNTYTYTLSVRNFVLGDYIILDSATEVSAIGYGHTSTGGYYSMIMGENCVNDGWSSFCGGVTSTVGSGKLASFSFGNSCDANGDHAVALGYFAKANHNGAMVLGSTSSTGADQFSSNFQQYRILGGDFEVASNVVVDGIKSQTGGGGTINFYGATLGNCVISDTGFNTLYLDGNWVTGPNPHISMAWTKVGKKGASISSIFIKNYSGTIISAVPSISQMDIPIPVDIRNAHTSATIPFTVSVINVNSSPVQVWCYIVNSGTHLRIKRVDGNNFTNFDSIEMNMEMIWQTYTV